MTHWACAQIYCCSRIFSIFHPTLMRQYQGVYPATTDEDILRNVFSIQLIAVQEKQKNGRLSGS